MEIAGHIYGRRISSLGLRLRERRVRRLTSSHTRDRLARQLEDTIKAAETPQVLRGSAVPVNRGEIRRCQGLLRELATELACDDPVMPRGVLMVQSLLRDGASPMYATDVDGVLEFELRHARTALLLK